MRNMMVEYVVMQLFSKWEKFLEEVFIEYMLGGCSLNGDIVNKYVNPIDRDHAYRMIQNVNLYPDWSDMQKIIQNLITASNRKLLEQKEAQEDC